jgi:hypothetical protein
VPRKSPFDGASTRAPSGPGRPGARGGAVTTTVAALGLKTEFQTEFDLEDGLDLEDRLDLEDEPELDFDDAPSPRSDLTPSYLDAKPPHRTKPQSRLTRTRRPKRNSRLRRWVAVPVLALLVVAGLALTSVIVGLVRAEMNAASGAAAASSPLVVPAPAMAGGLPRRYLPVGDPATQQLMAEFIRRFTTVVGSYAGRPGALYREPGAIDMANEQGWVMYLGHNSAASLGSPNVTIGRLMAALTATSAPEISWPAAPGPRGGSAQCALTLLGTTTVTLCAWATEHTIGALMSPTAETKRNELAVLMRVMRLDLQPGPSSRHVPGHAFQ